MKLRATRLGCPNAQAAEDWAKALDAMRKDGNSVGALIEVVARGLPCGDWCADLCKLDTALAAAMMSINAVKGVEIECRQWMPRSP